MSATNTAATLPASLTIGELIALDGDTYRVESFSRPSAVAAELERSGFDGNCYIVARVLKARQRAARMHLVYRSATTGALTIAC